jgi:hypothetical protein
MASENIVSTSESVLHAKEKPYLKMKQAGNTKD